MKIGTTLPVYNNSVLLRKGVAKALIQGGVFDHSPSKVLWALPANFQAAAPHSKPRLPVQSGGLPATVVGPAKPMTDAEMQTLIDRVIQPKPGITTKTGALPIATFAPTPTLSPVKLPKIGELHPVEVPRGNSKKIERALGLTEAALPLAHQLSHNPALGQMADGFAGVLAGVEIINNLVNPKDRNTVEAAFFYAQKTATLANSVADFVPAMHAAKPFLTVAITLMKVGDEVRLCIQSDDEGASKKGGSSGGGQK